MGHVIGPEVESADVQHFTPLSLEGFPDLVPEATASRFGGSQESLLVQSLLQGRQGYGDAIACGARKPLDGRVRCVRFQEEIVAVQPTHPVAIGTPFLPLIITRPYSVQPPAPRHRHIRLLTILRSDVGRTASQSGEQEVPEAAGRFAGCLVLGLTLRDRFKRSPATSPERRSFRVGQYAQVTRERKEAFESRAQLS